MCFDWGVITAIRTALCDRRRDIIAPRQFTALERDLEVIPWTVCGQRGVLMTCAPIIHVYQSRLTVHLAAVPSLMHELTLHEGVFDLLSESEIARSAVPARDQIVRFMDQSIFMRCIDLPYSTPAYGPRSRQ